MCVNKKCPHWGAGGCKLFNGQSWRRCRRAVEFKPTKQKGKKPNGK